MEGSVFAVFSSFSKRSQRGKEFNPNHRLSASLLERLCLPSHQFNIPPPPPPSKLSTPTSSGMLRGFVVLRGPGCVCVLWGFTTSRCACIFIGERDTKWSQNLITFKETNSHTFLINISTTVKAEWKYYSLCLLSSYLPLFNSQIVSHVNRHLK